MVTPVHAPKPIWTAADTLIGGILTRAAGAYVDEPDDSALTDVMLSFDVNGGSRSLVLSAVPENDAIDVAVLDDVNEWFAADRPHASREPLTFFQRFLTTRLTSLWICESAHNYADAVDLALGDLNYPTTKVLCISSELKLFSIVPDTGA